MNIFVGCGSRIPKNEEYCSLAEEIGRAIVEKKDNFVFGAYNHGLMGIIYQIVEKSKNSSVIAVWNRLRRNWQRNKLLPNVGQN